LKEGAHWPVSCLGRIIIWKSRKDNHAVPLLSRDRVRCDVVACNNQRSGYFSNKAKGYGLILPIAMGLYLSLMPVLNSQPDMIVIGQAGTAREAIELSKALRPAVVLLDFGLPDGSGLDAMRSILADRPETKIVFVTVHAENKLLLEAIRRGPQATWSRCVGS
jgi:CheY-like chemotaxis protein